MSSSNSLWVTYRGMDMCHHSKKKWLPTFCYCCSWRCVAWVHSTTTFLRLCQSLCGRKELREIGTKWLFMPVCNDTRHQSMLALPWRVLLKEKSPTAMYEACSFSLRTSGVCLGKQNSETFWEERNCWEVKGFQAGLKLVWTSESFRFSLKFQARWVLQL